MQVTHSSVDITMSQFIFYPAVCLSLKKYHVIAFTKDGVEIIMVYKIHCVVPIFEAIYLLISLDMPTWNKSI